MKLIRKGVFETNSSSSHSLSLGKDESKEFIMDTIFPDENGIITLEGGEFGWEWFKTNKAIDKANYAIASYVDDENMLDVIKELIEEHTIPGGINIIAHSGKYDEPGYSYVDHDSHGLCPSDKDELYEFIFNKNSWLFGGNDNSTASPGFYDTPTHTENGVIEIKYTHKLVCEQFPELTFEFKSYPTVDEIVDALSSTEFRVWMSDEYKGVHKKGDIQFHPMSWCSSDDVVEYDYKSIVNLNGVTLLKDLDGKALELCRKEIPGFDRWETEGGHRIFREKEEELHKLPENQYKIKYEIVKI